MKLWQEFEPYGNGYRHWGTPAGIKKYFNKRLGKVAEVRENPLIEFTTKRGLPCMLDINQTTFRAPKFFWVSPCAITIQIPLFRSWLRFFIRLLEKKRKDWTFRINFEWWYKDTPPNRSFEKEFVIF